MAPTTMTVTRARVLDLVRARPGVTVMGVARAAKLAHTTATYHLRVLEKRRAVVSMRSGNRLHWFANGYGGRHGQALVVCSLRGRAAEVLACVPHDRPAQLGEIARGLPDMTPPGVAWHLERLARLGLVAAHGHPGARGYVAVAPHAVTR